MAEREETLVATRESTGFQNVKRNNGRRDSRNFFWSCRVVSPWNQLPDGIKREPNLKCFTRQLDNYIRSTEWPKE